jgi:hypothetical protein
MNMKGWRATAVLATAVAIGLGAAPPSARAAGDAPWRIGAVIATSLYMPAKVLYAATGMMAGGIGWGLSGGSREARDAVMGPAIQGDYRITPEHLRGERSLEFIGVAARPIDDSAYPADSTDESRYEDLFYGE